MGESEKKYRTFHKISPRDYMYFPKGTIDLSKPGEFSRLEIQHILTAILALSVAFSFTISRNSLLMIYFFNGFSFERLMNGFAFSFVGIITAFFCHELAHKLIAQKYHLWSEFRMYPKALVASIILSISTGFVFAAPGAVMFRGKPRPFEEGRIAIAGPVANLVLAIIFTPIFLIVLYDTTGMLKQTVGFICIINIVFAAFNLLPFNPLDGAIVKQYNQNLWAILFIIAILLLIIISPFIATLVF
jgi:Zn-dependent protease